MDGRLKGILDQILQAEEGPYVFMGDRLLTKLIEDSVVESYGSIRAWIQTKIEKEDFSVHDFVNVIRLIFALSDRESIDEFAQAAYLNGDMVRRWMSDHGHVFAPDNEDRLQLIKICIKVLPERLSVQGIMKLLGYKISEYSSLHTDF